MQISVQNGRTMSLTHNILFLLFFYVTWAHGQADLESNDLNVGDYGDFELLKDTQRRGDVVIVDIFYEVHCPHCINFYLKQFAPILETITPYVISVPYPFGNAKIIYDKGKEEVKCQHGPAECYGNKLHACAFINLNHKSSLIYNACLMNSTDGLGSDDKSADRCGKLMNVNSERIKKCAKGKLGEELLIFIGKITKRNKISHIPYVFINGEVYDVKGNDLKKRVCDLLTNPPPACKNGDMS